MPVELGGVKAAGAGPNSADGVAAASNADGKDKFEGSRPSWVAGATRFGLPTAVAGAALVATGGLAAVPAAVYTGLAALVGGVLSRRGTAEPAAKKARVETVPAPRALTPTPPPAPMDEPDTEARRVQGGSEAMLAEEADMNPELTDIRKQLALVTVAKAQVEADLAGARLASGTRGDRIQDLEGRNRTLLTQQKELKAKLRDTRKKLGFARGAIDLYQHQSGSVPKRGRE